MKHKTLNICNDGPLSQSYPLLHVTLKRILVIYTFLQHFSTSYKDHFSHQTLIHLYSAV